MNMQSCKTEPLLVARATQQSQPVRATPGILERVGYYRLHSDPWPFGVEAAACALVAADGCGATHLAEALVGLLGEALLVLHEGDDARIPRLHRLPQPLPLLCRRSRCRSRLQEHHRHASH